MRKILNIIISKIKHENFYLDSQIPKSYILRILTNKVINLIYGCIRMRKIKFIFICPSSRLVCLKKISCGNNLSIDRYCFLDALSINGIQIGNNVSIGKSTTIECTGSLKLIGKGIIIGNNVGLGTHGYFGCAGGIEIGNNTIFGNYVSLHSENHNFNDISIPIRLQGVNHKGIKIGNDCWIGAKVTILDGTILGDGCVVAAGAVVRGYIPPYSVIGGIPAKILKSRL